MSRLIFRLSLFFVASAAFPARAEDPYLVMGEDFSIRISCEKHFAELGINGPTIARSTLGVEHMRKEKFPVSEIPNARRKESIFIGIANNEESKEGTHHYYVVAGKMRFEAKPLFGKSEGKGGILSKGVVFEVPVPPEAVAGLEARFKGKDLPRGITCLHAVCKILDEGGVVIEGAEKGQPIRTKMVAASLMQGKITVNGAAVDPATMRLFESHEDELLHFVQEALTGDEIMASKVKSALAVRGVLMLAVPGIPVGILLYNGVKERDPEKKR